MIHPRSSRDISVTIALCLRTVYPAFDFLLDGKILVLDVGYADSFFYKHSTERKDKGLFETKSLRGIWAYS